MIDLFFTLVQPCEGHRYTVLSKEGGQDEPEGMGYLEIWLYKDGLKEIGLFFFFAWGIGNLSKM